jgi:Holliday junction resolvase RusA-like endonuclease
VPVKVRLVVHGHPAPQGSKDAYRNQHTGRIQQVESSAKVKPWRADVKAAAEDAVCCPCPDNCGTLMPGYPLDGPLYARMVFTFVRPASHWRTGRNAHLLRASAPARPKGRPDASKLLRSTEDALTGLLWTDDSRVVDYERVAKVWAGEDPEALDVPGALIVVWPALDALPGGETSDSAARRGRTEGGDQ